MKRILHASDFSKASRHAFKKAIEMAKTTRPTLHLKTTSTIVQGVPADRIVRAARAKHADLVVMGTHGRTGFSRFLLGSVASRVVATSPCPVLTVAAWKAHLSWSEG